MILVDSSVWIDHLRHAEPDLLRLLSEDEVLSHPLVVGEVMMGRFKRRDEALEIFRDLEGSIESEHERVLEFVALHELFGKGIGYIDAHLLVSTQMTPGARFWTRDRRLMEVAVRLDLGYSVRPERVQ